MGKCVIRPICYSDILSAPNADSLIAGYADECSIPAIGKAAPQAEMYAKMEAANLMQCFGAYRDAELIGFASVLIGILPHYGQRVATMESLYVDPEYRGYAGHTLLAAIENFASEADCVALLYSAPVGSKLERVLSLRASCIRTNSVFCKRLA